MPSSDRGGDNDLVQRHNKFRETQDRHSLRTLRKINYLRPGMSWPLRRRKIPLTLIFAVKTTDRLVAPPSGFRIKRPYNNFMQSVYKVLWWRDLGRITLLEARQDTARYLDEIYRMIERHQPIVGLRAILIDWTDGKPIPRDVILDPWFYERAFGGRYLDAAQLRAWGMDSNYVVRTRPVKPPAKENAPERAAASTLEALHGTMVDQVIERAIVSIVSTTLPAWMRASGVMLLPRERAMLMLKARRAILALRNQNTERRLKAHLESEFQVNSAFAKKMRSMQARRILLAACVKWLTREVAERYLTTLR